MAHSNQVREFRLSDNGIELVDVYVGPGTVFTGAARLRQEAKERAQAMVEQQAVERRQRELEQERAALEAQIEALRAKLGTSGGADGRGSTGEGEGAGGPQRTKRSGRCSPGGLKGRTMPGKSQRNKPAAAKSTPSEQWNLRLYVAGQTSRAMQRLQT